MTCRVGITTDLVRRKAEHEAKYRNVRNWQREAVFASRDDAQAWEDDHPCSNKSPSGRDARGPWYGYVFILTRIHHV